jgi:hypothetical protein
MGLKCASFFENAILESSASLSIVVNICKE